mgnify:FL=1|tara:strand:+ start:614 stop:799 length:186 start_codon:yes stop_codon:yes gene_type:complete
MTTNEQLREIAETSSLSRKDLATILEVSPETVRNWLRDPQTRNYRSMPGPMLKLLKIVVGS